MAEIEVSHIQEFKANIRLALQKTTSLMRPHVRVDTDVKGEGYRPEMTVGKAGYQRRDTRFEPKTAQELTMAARWCEPFDYDVGPFYEDKLDRIRNGMAVDGTYVTAAAAAIRRAEDDVTLAAAFGSAKTGKNGSGAAATFDTSNMQVAAGSAGMTVNKTISAKQILKREQNDLRSETPRLSITEIQWGNIMRDVTYTSAEFTSGRPLEKGEAERILGFQLVEFPSTEYAYTTGGERRCLFWVPSGLLLADYDLTDPKVRQAAEMRGEPWEVYGMFTLGAARLDEKKVGHILCAE
jgi:hypothetical protein